MLDDSSGETLEVMCPRVVTAANTTTTATLAVNEDNGSSILSDNLRPGANNNTLGITATGLSIDLAGVDVGSIVKVKGGIGEFRGVKQMTLEKISASANILSVSRSDRIQLLFADPIYYHQRQPLYD